MKSFGRNFIAVAVVFTAIAGLVMAGCAVANMPDAPETGSISGRAYFVNSGSHAGITVTLEKTDGLRSAAALAAMRNTASGARSITVSRAAASGTQTAADGSYSFKNVAPGTYTIYASSPHSGEKAVAVNNVTVEAGRAVTASDLNLTAVGSITGRILLDDNTDTGNLGFLVCIAGTSYMAITGNDGRFTISDIPAGSGYLVVIMKGSFTALWASETASVTGGQAAAIMPNTRNFTTDEIGGIGLIWQGEDSEPPSDPQQNWAYYNTADKTSYIWNGIKWDVLAAQGANGKDGKDGAAGTVITISEDGYWVINEIKTNEKARGVDGSNGAPGIDGTPGTVITISGDGYWVVDGVKTGEKARGENGIDGADGNDGAIGSILTIENGKWHINGADTGITAQGPQGVAGPQGPQGETGNTGSQGSPGNLTAVYTVSFNSNGGSNVLAVIAMEGQTAAKPQNPTRTGYAFDNWYSNETLTTAYNFANPVNGNLLLYAKWIVNQYTVAFESNGGSAVAPRTVNYGEKVTQPANPAKTGWGFAGWYSNSGLTTAYNFDAAVTGNTTLYAKWSTTYYIVTYNSNSGSAVNSETVLVGDIPTRPADPTRSGYAFDGWFSNSGLTTPYNFDVSITGAITIYAKWLTTYTVSYNTYGGSAVPSQIVPTGTATAKPEDPVNPPLIFDGWYTSAEMTETWNFNTSITGSRTLHARWVTGNGDPDFEPGTAIAQIFTVATTAEWESAKSAISGNNKNYIINVIEDIYVSTTTNNINYGTFSGTSITITIRGIGTTGNRILTSSTDGIILKLGANSIHYQRIILHNITLKGRIAGVDGAGSDNTSPLALINTNSAAYCTLDMKGTSAILGNAGNAVTVGGGSTFTMWDNSLITGVGTYPTVTSAVVISGTFIMQDNAKISGNPCGGVNGSGTFIMRNNAIISDNIGSYGGGVYIGNSSGSFFMEDNAQITGNTASMSGGGVCMTDGTIFTMRGNAKISGNTITASGYGGGVYVANGALFRFEGGIIYGNSAGANSNRVLINEVSENGRGAAIYNLGQAECGTLNDTTGVFTIKSYLNTTDSTISVVNGVSQ